MRTAAIGGGSSARSSRSRATTAWSDSARWAAAANRPIATVLALKPSLVGRDPARLEEMRFLLANPTASLYNNRTQVVAALEFACLDLLGQAWGVPVSDILGGGLRDRVPFASYLFFRYAERKRHRAPCARSSRSSRCAKRTEAAVRVSYAQAEGRRLPSGLRSRVLSRARRGASRATRFRFDPNAVWTTEQAIRFGQAIEDLDNDYLEDPVFGLTGMRHARRAAARPARHQHRGRQLRTARRQRAAARGRRDPARHHVLGRHSRRA